MKKLGTIVEIIGPSTILIKGTSDLSPKEVLSVFAEIINPLLNAKHGLSRLQIPKGEVRVLARQDDDFYIAEVFRPRIQSTKVARSATSSLLMGILGEEVVNEESSGPISASLGKPTIPIEVAREVIVGDYVGKD
jgi:hypothetical protein